MIVTLHIPDGMDVMDAKTLADSALTDAYSTDRDGSGSATNAGGTLNYQIEGKWECYTYAGYWWVERAGEELRTPAGGIRKFKSYETAYAAARKANGLDVW